MRGDAAWRAPPGGSRARADALLERNLTLSPGYQRGWVYRAEALAADGDCAGAAQALESARAGPRRPKGRARRLPNTLDALLVDGG